MLVETIKSRVKEAMIARNNLERDILRLALGELQTAEARGETLTDESAEKVIRKVVKSINETLEAIEGNDQQAEQRVKLQAEREVLETLLPKRLTPDEIAAALADVADDIRAAGNPGQAMGVAMKHLKAGGAPVDGKDVSAAVKLLRG